MATPERRGEGKASPAADLCLRGALLLLLVAAILQGCEGETGPPPPPREIAEGSACTIDGMLLAEYGGPKAQIRLRSEERTRFFCQVPELFHLYLEPGRSAETLAVYVQDTAAVDWKKPEAGWIDARKAFYVIGSRMEGAMGPTYAPFSRREDAQAFAGRQGGHIMEFEEVLRMIREGTGQGR